MNLHSFLKKRFLPHFEDCDRIYNLTGSSAAVFLALAPGPFVAIEKDSQSAEVLKKDIDFYSKLCLPRQVLCMPEAEGPELAGERAGIILNMGTEDSLVTSFQNLHAGFWDRELLDEQLLRVRLKAQQERSAVEGALLDLGYRAVSMVMEKGQYSQRGWIIDVFPSTSEYPVRIEFFGDEIEQLRMFDVDSQKSVKDVDDITIFPAQEPELSWGLKDIAGDRRWYCLFTPDEKELLPPQTTFLSRYSFESGSLPDETSDEGLSAMRQTDAGLFSVSGLGILPQERKSLEALPETIARIAEQQRVMIFLPSAGQAERLRDLFKEQEIELPRVSMQDLPAFEGGLSVTEGKLSCGLHMEGLLILTEREIFGERRAYRQQKRSKVANLLASLDDIVPGDFVVHRDHGVGKFSGIVRRQSGSTELELMQLEYQDGRLYIPIQNIEALSKYRSEEGVVPNMDKLGGKTWEKKKERARKKVHELAEKLVALYAGRKVARGFTFTSDTELHREFDGFFPYEETPDQLTAIADIKRDMESEKPMDRLLCGDVGYGKTEVAMRAAFKAVYDNRQVAVLVPTTILAEQHYRNFRERFSGFPVRIDHVSRFRSRKEINDTLKALSAGEVDIVIGTHALLSKKLEFSSLGLLIVDEEHKFGVSQKERIKELARSVDVLNMTATPIPRTLHMALSGIREISVIETPPEERLAVRTTVTVFNESLIKDAISRELERNGQVFFVHNRISDIYKIGQRIQMLVPEARLAIAHGQMPDRELEDIMHRFFEMDVNILLSTSIIGSGLDIPRANTIIINRADKMGLADLYQLRGRVGRGNLRGYAFCIIPGESLMSDEAKKRLQALQEMSYLGAGFRLAMKDLEIRGAGNIFGPEQSGHIHEIGFDLYIEMLEKAVAELRGEDIREEIEPVIDLNISAYIPETYVEDVMIRMGLYRRISSLKTEKNVDELGEELRDRFGKLPLEVSHLLAVMRLKLVARELMTLKIQTVQERVRVLFSPDTPVQPEMVFNLHGQWQGRMKFLPDGFEIDMKKRDTDTMLTEIYQAADTLRQGLTVL
ncbi:MAG: transcription-repair coupling factor [Nitrospirae bacterium]|nr:transcription-repair coupling factor [Nitrospirota bacterium]